MTPNNPYRGAFLLILAAAGLLVIAAATGRGDITTATLVLAGTGCFIAGVFLLTLNKGEPLDPGLLALLPAQGTITIATLCADLGVQGDAWFVPDDGTVIQVIPVGETLPTMAQPPSGSRPPAPRSSSISARSMPSRSPKRTKASLPASSRSATTSSRSPRRPRP